jgi:hypothetical protein
MINLTSLNICPYEPRALSAGWNKNMDEPKYKTDIQNAQGTVLGEGNMVIMMFQGTGSSETSQELLESIERHLEQLPEVRPYRLLQVEELAGLLGSIVQKRMQAEDWKQLHKDFQTVSLKLVMLRGATSPDNPEMTLQILEMVWRDECSDMIQRFTKLDRLPDRTVQEKFRDADRDSKWLERLQSAAEDLDRIVNQSVTVDDLRVDEVRDTLYNLERVSSQLLNFLDDQLQKTIKELDTDIEKLRATFIP